MYVTTDKYGQEMVLIQKSDIEDFSKFITTLRAQGCGATTGIVKVRLHPDDRNDAECVSRILNYLKRKFAETVLVVHKKDKKIKKSSLLKHSVDIVRQSTFKAASKPHFYEYVRESADEERQMFVDNALNTTAYEIRDNCCSDALSEGLSSAQAHFFNIVDKRSTYTPERRETTLVESERMGEQQEPSSPILYGTGISCPKNLEVAIGGVLDMKNLGTVTDKLDEKYDGIAFPNLYCGSSHSFFCWHIEEGALCSINYVFAGASKIWFTIPPKYFGFVEKVLTDCFISKAHSVCQAALSDHKCVLFDPEFMKRTYGVPYVVVKQDPGDFIITWPFTLNSGFNTGTNLSMAVNFGDALWIDDGVYAPGCDCREVINIDLTPILKIYRPHLLQKWQDCGARGFPVDHPRTIVQPLCEGHDVKSNDETAKSNHNGKPKMYRCPSSQCSKVFVDHRKRLIQHIQKTHSGQAEALLEQMVHMYPPSSSLKTSRANVCKVCQTVIFGSVSHLERHMMAQIKNRKLSGNVTSQYKDALTKVSSHVKRRKNNYKFSEI